MAFGMRRAGVVGYIAPLLGGQLVSLANNYGDRFLLAASVDRSLHDLLSSALLGGSGGMELVEVHAEGKRLWEVTASSLFSAQENVAGAVLRMAPPAAAPDGDSSYEV